MTARDNTDSDLILLGSTDLVLAGPVGSLDAYISAANRVPVLSAEDERALAIRYRDFDDIDAARAMVLAHLRFVVHVSRGYMGYGLPLGDLIQEGNVGLMKAVKRFDPEVGVRLVSFAVHWIRAEMHEFILRNWRIVKVATTKAQRKLFFNLRSKKKRLGWLNHEEVEAVAKDLGVSPKDVLEMESRLAAHDASYDPQPVDDEDTYAPVAYLTDDSPDPAGLVEEADWEDTNGRRLRDALATLDDRSRDIMQQRWMDDGKTTLQELADTYGVSAERIRQVETAAIKKLRTALAV